MAWDEAQYVVDEVLDGIQTKQITGIPPKNVSNFSVSDEDGSAIIKCTPPSDTIIDNQLICTVAGVRIIRKVGSPPISPEDGTLVANVPRGQTITKTDTGLTNGVTYYYGFFPYSDHGVFNYNQANIRRAIPSSAKFWAFDQNFLDLNPATTITYPVGFRNSYYTPMRTNEDRSPSTPGDWLDFLQNTLKNYPYMVRKDGHADYALDPNDYTKKKKNGLPSDYNNLNYGGSGAFAWLNKIWMREEYSSDGESREVQFSDKAADGFYPTGFINQNNQELSGLWLPMGYLNDSGKTLVSGGTISVGKKLGEYSNMLVSGYPNGVFLGGPILNVLRDLEYMMFKNTNIQSVAGFGYSNGWGGRVPMPLKNAVVPNGNVPGWYGSSLDYNKYFHSQVLGGYQIWLMDPYWINSEGISYISPNYKYDPGALNGYINIGFGIESPDHNSTGSWYPNKTIQLSSSIGSIPDPRSDLGSSTTGLCDSIELNVPGIAIHYMITHFGSYKYGWTGGPTCIGCMHDSYNGYSNDLGVAFMVLPPAGYTP